MEPRERPDRGSVNSIVLLAFSHMSTNVEFSPADADLTHRLVNQVVYPMRMVGRTSVKADHAIGFAIGIVAIKVGKYVTSRFFTDLWPLVVRIRFDTLATPFFFVMLLVTYA